MRLAPVQILGVLVHPHLGHAFVVLVPEKFRGRTKKKERKKLSPFKTRYNSRKPNEANQTWARLEKSVQITLPIGNSFDSNPFSTFIRLSSESVVF